MTDLSKFSLDYAVPADDLKELISSFYLFQADIDDTRQSERADRAQFRFLLAGGGGYEFCDGHYMDSAAVTIIGPTTGPTTGIIKGPLEIFGAGLQPAGWGALMGGEAEKYINRLIDATAIFGTGLLDVHAALGAAASLAEKVAIGNDFTRGLLAGADASPLWFTRIVDGWLIAGPSPRLDDLIAQTGLSNRQVERMTKRFYGASPKLLARKYRALRAASALVRNEQVDDGFYDQSHLIREIKQFTGFTPGKMRKQTEPLTRATTERRKLLSGEVNPLISDT